VKLIIGLVVASIVLIALPFLYLWPYPGILCLLLALYLADRDRMDIVRTVSSTRKRRRKMGVVVGGGAAAVVVVVWLWWW